MSKKFKTSDQDGVEIDVNAFEETPIVEDEATEQVQAEPASTNDSAKEEPVVSPEGEGDVMDVIEKLNAENAQCMACDWIQQILNASSER